MTKWNLLGSKAQDWRNAVLTAPVIVDRVVEVRCELLSGLETIIVGHYGWIPSRVAIWVTIVSSQIRCLGAVEEAVEVLKKKYRLALTSSEVVIGVEKSYQLLSGVILHNTLSISLQFINTVLVAEDSSCNRVLAQSNRIPQAIADQNSVNSIIVHSAGVADVKCSNCAVS